MSDTKKVVYKPTYEPIGSLVGNVENPRYIDDVKFGKLVASIRNFPAMLDIRPIVIDENNVILGGNMRHKACIEAGLEEVPVLKVSNLTEEQKKEFIMKDNISYGDWDWSMLSQSFDAFQLDEWALDIDPSMFNLEKDDTTMDEAKDNTKFNDFTIFFSDEREMDIWYAFLKNLKDKFSEHENVSERVLHYIAEVYDDNKMSDSKRILKFIGYDVEED
ncbi:ParB N-terminal domain-containing protein [candidate division WWE3 bacterium]|jgi:hypothetical protein|nr:ParB N-terminal domain-containing protein [candidate division WWE3 bacterium]